MAHTCCGEARKKKWTTADLAKMKMPGAGEKRRYSGGTKDYYENSLYRARTNRIRNVWKGAFASPYPGWWFKVKPGTQLLDGSGDGVPRGVVWGSREPYDKVKGNFKKERSRLASEKRRARKIRDEKKRKAELAHLEKLRKELHAGWKVLDANEAMKAGNYELWVRPNWGPWKRMPAPGGGAPTNYVFVWNVVLHGSGEYLASGWIPAESIEGYARSKRNALHRRLSCMSSCGKKIDQKRRSVLPKKGKRGTMKTYVIQTVSELSEKIHAYGEMKISRSLVPGRDVFGHYLTRSPDGKPSASGGANGYLNIAYNIPIEGGTAGIAADIVPSGQRFLRFTKYPKRKIQLYRLENGKLEKVQKEWFYYGFSPAARGDGKETKCFGWVPRMALKPG